MGYCPIPSRLLCPWDSPGKNTGVGCHFLLQCMHACMLSRFSHVWLCAILWTAAPQAPLTEGFSRQEYWSGLLFPSPVVDHTRVLSHFSRVRFCATPWTATHQAPLFTGFSRQEYWSGLHFLLQYNPAETLKSTSMSGPWTKSNTSALACRFPNPFSGTQEKSHGELY